MLHQQPLVEVAGVQFGERQGRLRGNRRVVFSGFPARNSLLVPELVVALYATRTKGHVRDSPQKSGLIAALAAYAVLAALATLTLTGKMRIAVWIFLGGMAVKTWLSSLHQS